MNAAKMHDRKVAEAAPRASDQQLRDAQAELEERVRQRTDELIRANQRLQAELRDRRAAQQRIAGLLKQLVTIQEEERHRVAREIHDQLGQPMSAMRMHLEALQMRSGSAALAEPIGGVLRLAEQLDRSIDFLTWQLRPSVIEDLGISDALANLVSSWSQQFQLAAAFESDDVEDLCLPSDVETHIYRIAQEALHNIYKHAHADRVLVRLQRRNGEVVLGVADNGCGFATSGHNVFVAGMGLSNMRDRATLAGGELFVFWSRSGTTVELRLPTDGQLNSSGVLEPAV